MINVLRKNSRWLWFVIAILAIPFVFYFVQRPDYGSMRSNIFGKLYGRPVSTIEIERGARMFDLGRDLGMVSFLQDLIGSSSYSAPAPAFQRRKVKPASNNSTENSKSLSFISTKTRSRTR